MVEIKEISDDQLTITRQKSGEGFIYFDANEERIESSETLERLNALVIPPMWEEVRICELDCGHIQAVGRDRKGRKQYLYHEAYEKLRQEEKFRKLMDFTLVLPEIRRQAYEDLKTSGWPRNKVSALVVLLLDEYGIRIGNYQYKHQNNTYGLTTLRRKHLTLEDDELVFSFTGKSNTEREVYIDDAELIRYIKEAADLPGYEIFRYRDDSGRFQRVDSEDINAYIAGVMGGDFSSKFFRTWAANRLTIDVYPEAITIHKTGSRKKFSNLVLEMVASELGHTPAVCKDYYVHPAIYTSVESSTLPESNPFRDSEIAYGLTASEKLAKQIIESSYQDSAT